MEATAAASGELEELHGLTESAGVLRLAAPTWFEGAASVDVTAVLVVAAVVGLAATAAVVVARAEITGVKRSTEALRVAAEESTVGDEPVARVQTINNIFTKVERNFGSKPNKF